MSQFLHAGRVKTSKKSEETIFSPKEILSKFFAEDFPPLTNS